MSEEETEIRTLIERWAVAVHEGDTDAVLGDHAEDIVMFDVPPPADASRRRPRDRRLPSRLARLLHLAARRGSWNTIRTTGYGSPWGCAAHVIARRVVRSAAG
jgi:hypothetical protein